VLDDLMNNVDPSDPYGGPVWGMQSGDIGSTYEYGGQPVMLAGQQQMPESWVQQQRGGQPVIMQPNSGNLQYIPNPRAIKNSDAQAKMQKLWMFNMGYEHHEQV
jgi:hypothetical protein